MKNIDYEYLFIYVSLILAVSIFIIILYGCMFASKPNPHVFENFLNDEVDKELKDKILTILKDYENKSAIPEENKHFSELIDKIKNDKITITDLKLLIVVVCPKTYFFFSRSYSIHTLKHY